ncbi:MULTISPECIES: ABC transporter permease subunit [Saliphagus]|uniref:ABC transporter permease subunit n=1 Tax=Saliphagus infecundisoli TaxID=1849069 RepID=A0ABD5QJU4_9EURY|nr:MULTISPECIES: ABC transporter permease subunit [Saliphagus]
MSWAHIARKDFADAGRSLTLWVVTGLLILLVAGMTAIPSLLETEEPFGQALYFLFSAVALVIPIVGLLLGYNAVVGERESGSIRFLLGLPNTRRDVVWGKLLGRTAVVVVASVVAFAVGAGVIAWLYDGFVVSDYLALLAFTVVMGLVYLSIAIGVSASVSSRGKAIAGVLGLFVLFDVVWQSVPMGIYYLLEGSWPTLYGEGSLPAWFVLVERLSPGQALSAVAIEIVDVIDVAEIDLTAAGRVAGEVPFYLETWFAGVIVIAWIAVPIAIGYARFSRAVLN